jgi:hypothetical protein
MRIVIVVVLMVGVSSGVVVMTIHHELAPIYDQSVILPDMHDSGDEEAWNVTRIQEPAPRPAVPDTVNVWVDYPVG